MRFKKENKTLDEQWWKVDVLDSSGNAGVVYVSSTKDGNTALKDANDIMSGDFSSTYRNHEKLNMDAVNLHSGNVGMKVSPVTPAAVNMANLDDVLHLTDRSTRREINNKSKNNKTIYNIIYKSLHARGEVTSDSEITDDEIREIVNKNYNVYIHHINGKEFDNSPDNVVIFPYANRNKWLPNILHSLTHKANIPISNKPGRYKISTAILCDGGIYSSHDVYIDIV